jgi:hypothetical protein
MVAATQASIRRLFSVMVAAAIALGLWPSLSAAQPAPPQAPPASLPAVSIVARDGAFEAPASVPAGLVAITFENATARLASASIVRLNPGATVEAVSGALQADDAGTFFELITPAGGVATITPGTSQEVVLTLAEGDHVVFSFTGEGEAPMVHPFRAAGSVADGAVIADGEVIMRDFAFSVPPIRAGRMTLKVVNAGVHPHEMLLGKLAPGHTLWDVFTAEETGTDPVDAGPVELVGGLAAVEAGATAWLTPTLTPGTYAMVCFVPEPSTGKPHAQLGMATEFTVP